MTTTNNPDDVTTLATQQPLPLGLIDGQPVPSPAADEAPSRLARLRQAAGAKMGDLAAEAWMTEPTPALGGLAPVDLAADSDEGCDAAIGHLTADHRPRDGDHG